MAAREPTVPANVEPSAGGIAIEVSRYKADMARQKNIEYFLAKSGDLANTEPIHRALRAGCVALHAGGLDCSPIIAVLDEASRLSPDQDGKSRKEGLQLLEDSPVIIPGVGASGLRPVEEVGRIEHLKRMVFGNPSG
jgi:hypothetical protein